MADRSPVAAHGSSPADLAARLAAERRQAPFLVYRDQDGNQVIVELAPGSAGVTVGRRAGIDVALEWDREVSRIHAQLEPVGPDWALVDDGLSRNGSYVNGERVVGRRRLRDGDRLCFGETLVVFCAPAHEPSYSTAAVGLTRGTAMPLTEVQRRVVIALCRPMRESSYAHPATNREIADEVHLSVDAVKAHLRVIFERVGLEDVPQNRKRAQLAALAIVNGLVHPHDF